MALGNREVFSNHTEKFMKKLSILPVATFILTFLEKDFVHLKLRNKKTQLHLNGLFFVNFQHDLTMYRILLIKLKFQKHFVDGQKKNFTHDSNSESAMTILFSFS